MRKPNDKKRPNTNSGKETRDRKRNQKFIWVSKRILEVEVPGLPGVQTVIAEPKGRTYRPHTDSLAMRSSKKAFRKFNKGILTRKESDALRRSMQS